MTIQWQRAGADLRDSAEIIGSTRTNVTLLNAQTNLAGNYQAIVSNAGGSVTSLVAKLTVNARPANDNFANRIFLSGTNLLVTGSSQYGSKEAGEPKHANMSGSASVWWSWTAPQSGVVVMDLTNSFSGSVLGVYTGTALNALSLVASNYGGNVSGNTGKVRFPAKAGAEYQIAVDGYASGYEGIVKLSLVFYTVDAPPEITLQPKSVTVKEGETAKFTVSAISVTPMTIQWQRSGVDLGDNVAIIGAAGTNLTLLNTLTNQAGSYQAIVSNAGGSVTSLVAALTVNARPANDNFASRIFLTGSNLLVTGSSQYGSKEAGEPKHANMSGSASVWWSWMASQPGLMLLDLTNSFSGAVLGVYTGTSVKALSLVASNYGGNASLNTGKLRFAANGGTVYQIAVDGSSSVNEGAIKLRVALISPPIISSQPQSVSITTGEKATLSVAAASLIPMTWQWLINGTNFVGATNSSITITNATAAETGRYSVLVSNDAGTIASQEAILKLVSVVKGQVTDALNGKPLHGVMVSMGGVTNITDASGNYRLDDVNPGSAHADFDADVRTGAAPLRVNFINLSTLTGNTLNATTNGYDAYSDQKVKVIPNEAVTVNFSMSPILPANTMRLVLNWRSDPKDLDAHLLTPSINGSNYHVYYNPGSRGSLTNWPFASLDFDYTNGFGPETMTITNFYDGTYQFFVHHYSSDAPSTNSGAAVRIYTAENPPRIIDVPNLLHGQYFHVCNIDGVTRNITVIQQILDTSPFLQKQSGTVIKPNSIAATRRILAIDEAQTARYLWDFGDGSTSSEDAPGKTYSIPGEYTVTLRMETSGSQYHVIEKTNFITVLQAAQPEIQISNIRVQEGNAGLADALFPVTLSRPGNQAVSIDYYTTNGTAKAGIDYQEIHGTLVINAGVTNSTIKVPIIGNLLNEPDKTFKVQLLNAANADITTGQATGTIENDDLEPTLLLAPATITEGNYGFTNMVFRVLLSAPSGQEVSVNYTTQDGTAKAGSNYLATNGVLTLPAGQTRASITVAIKGDLVPEPDKIFFVELSESVHAQIVAGQGRATGTIRDDDILPSFSISDGSVKEPLSGTTNVSLVVRLSSVSTETVTVEYGTSNGTAIAGKDYTEQTGVLTFPPGVTTTNLVIQVLADGKADGDKAFSVILRNPTKAVLDDDTGQVAILQSYILPPMTVVLTAPQNRTVYSYDGNNGIEPHITANVNAPGRNIWKVDYYRGSVFVASSEYGPNYTVLWSGVVPVGNYSLTAKAIDTKGNVAVSAPVMVCVSDTWRNVAIVQSSVDPEIATLKQYLYEMGVSSTVLNKGTLTEESLKPYKLVVWHGGTGTTSEISAQDVERVQELIENQTPVYFLGDTLLASANKLTDAQRSLWNSALHLKSAGVPLAGGKVALETNANPIVIGRYGMAAGFNHAGAMENAKADSTAEVIARNGTSDIMVAYPKPDGAGVKTITQDFLASDVLASGEKKILFQNAVNWLIKGPSCGLNPLTIQMEGPKGNIDVGQKIVYTIRASQTGDCTATGVVLTNYLPPSVVFDSADTYTGSYTYSDGKILFDLGLLNNNDAVEMKVTVIPKEAGEITNIASICGNGSVFDANNWATNKITVGGSLNPVLKLIRTTLNKSELRLSGKTGQAYRIQESKDLSSWLEITNTIQDGWSMPLPVSQPSKSPYLFYRAVKQ